MRYKNPFHATRATTICTFLFLSVAATWTTAQVFVPGGRYETGLWPECIVVGHFDGDPYTDIAVSHNDTDLVLIYINDGNASFSQSYSLEVSRRGGLHSADFDNDGVDDILMYDIGRLSEDWGTTVYMNNGDGTFELGLQDTLGWGWQHMCTGDFDSNDAIDIAVYNGPDSTGIWIYWGTGGGAFAEPVMIQPFPSDMWLDATDLDNDGNIDIVCASESETFSLINDGSGQFSDPLPAGGAMNGMALASLNGDAFPDLIGKGIYACTGVPHFMLGNGDGTFGIETRAWMTAGVLLKSYVMSADFNSDGYGDIAYYAYDMDSVAVGLNDGLQGFDNIEYISEVDTGGTYLAAGDFDNDGDADLAITGLDDTLSIALSLAAQHSNRILVPNDIPSIGEAIEQAWNLDTIIVEPGTYFENIDFGGKDLVLMSSDFAGKSSTDGMLRTALSSESTIIDGGGAGSVFTFSNSEDSRSVVAGFTIQNGHAVSYGGGGVLCRNPAAPTIIHNIIKDNHSSFIGGGIYVSGGPAIVRNNLIVGNSSESVGGGIYVIGGGDMTNNTVYGNSAVNGGGGMFYNSGSPSICNCIFWGNSSTNGEQEIRSLTDPPVITYSIVQGGWPGEGNLNEDPMFVDPDNGEFNLQAGSPCIDAGDPSLPPDPDGTTADIGAYYYPSPVDVDDDAILPDRFGLLQNYPNPFNPTTTIEYTLPRRAPVTIEIFNVLGQKVRALVDREQPPGSYTITWDGTDASGNPAATGVYLYRIRAGEHVETRKMLLLK